MYFRWDSQFRKQGEISLNPNLGEVTLPPVGFPLITQKG